MKIQDVSAVTHFLPLGPDLGPVASASMITDHDKYAKQRCNLVSGFIVEQIWVGRSPNLFLFSPQLFMSDLIMRFKYNYTSMSIKRSIQNGFEIYQTESHILIFSLLCLTNFAKNVYQTWWIFTRHVRQILAHTHR